MTDLMVVLRWASSHLLPCFYKQVFGISCPLCGGQRSVILLLEGQFWESMKMFPPLLPLAVTLLMVFLWRFWGLLGKKAIHVVIIDAIMLLFNMVYQNMLN